MRNAARKKPGESAEDAIDAHRKEPGGEVYGIAELSAEFGVTARALRFYESKDLLSPQRVNGTRVYGRRDRARLALILRAKALGSSLEEIKHYLDLYGQHGEGRRRQLEYVVKRTAAAIAALEAKKAQLDEALAELRIIYATSKKQLSEKRSNQGD
jgi:DNA-binding transcriptional MerR regulator